jgi:hypothetical protein
MTVIERIVRRMSDDQQQTCGKGLADHASLIAALGALATAMAENLDVHQDALDVTDENSRNELHAYVKMTEEFRCIASQLTATAGHMAGYRNLPMGRHDSRAMASPKVIETFKSLVRIEEDLLKILGGVFERHQAILGIPRQHAR